MSDPIKTPGNDPDLRIIEDSIKSLSEHFDSVHVFVTRHESNDVGTISIQRGSGNWYARFGQIRHWLLRQDAKEIEKGRQDQIADDNEENN